MALTRAVVWSKSLTPGALTGAIKVQELTFTTAAGDIPEYQEGPNTGGTAPGTYGFRLELGDVILVMPPSLNNSLCPVQYAYVSTAGVAGTAVLTLGFSNLTAAANTPAAGIYTFVLLRQ